MLGNLLAGSALMSGNIATQKPVLYTTCSTQCASFPYTVESQPLAGWLAALDRQRRCCHGALRRTAMSAAVKVLLTRNSLPSRVSSST
jgi:hypothetical protein